MSDTLKQEVDGNHYTSMAIQPIEYINKNNLDFNHGNVVKYISREVHKNKDIDVIKAIHNCLFVLIFDYGYSSEIENVVSEIKRLKPKEETK